MSLYYVRNNDTERLILSDNERLDLDKIKATEEISVDLGTYLSITDDLWNRNFIDESIANHLPFEKILQGIMLYFNISSDMESYPAINQEIIKIYISAITGMVAATQELSDELIKKELDTVFSIGAFLDSCSLSHIDTKPLNTPDDVKERLTEIKNTDLKLQCSNEVLYTFLGLIGKEPLTCRILVDLPVKQSCKFDSANEVYQTVSEKLINPSDMYYCYKVESISDLLVASLLEIFKSGYQLKKCGCCDQYFVPLKRGKQLYCHNEAKRYFYPFDGINEKKEYYYCDEWMKKISERKDTVPSVDERKEIKKLYDKLRQRFSIRSISEKSDKITYFYNDFIDEAGKERDKVRNGKSSWTEYIEWLEEKDKETKDKW